jgi:precorrin-6Y C5,15-methyltransferase (decarboxylating)
MKFIVIGITDNPKPFFPPDVLEIIKKGKIFSGGKRHHEIVAAWLPEDAQWIDIAVPIDDVFNQYSMLSDTLAENTIIVFASGDPLFYGFANTIRQRMPQAQIVLYPTLNSLQVLAHRLVMPYHDMRIVSLTGRPWHEFDRALIERASQIGVLTDREHTPSAIAQRMLDYGYNNYTIHVGERLGNPTEEKVTTLSLEETVGKDFAMPNCLILCGKSEEHMRPFGVSDTEFFLLDGREKMITKMPIRLMTLQALELRTKHTLWDIGFCTGSISIEARLQFPHLHVCSFEIRPECEDIIRKNASRFGVPGIDVYMGDFLKTDISSLPRPDAVFIGGHGGRLKEIMESVLKVLSPDGVIVMNSVVAPKVSTDSHLLWDEACKDLGLKQEPPMKIILNNNHPITILKCRKGK